MQAEFSNWTVGNLKKYVATNIHISVKELVEKLGTLKKEQWVGLVTELSRDQKPVIQVNCFGNEYASHDKPPIKQTELTPRQPIITKTPRKTPRKNITVKAPAVQGTDLDMRTRLQQELLSKFKSGVPPLRPVKKNVSSSSSSKSVKKPINKPPPPPPPPLPPKKKVNI